MFLQKETSVAAKLGRNNGMSEVCVFWSKVYVLSIYFKGSTLDVEYGCLIGSLEKILLEWCMLYNSLMSLLQMRLIIIV